LPAAVRYVISSHWPMSGDVRFVPKAEVGRPSDPNS
jgi:hypothetical protein